METVKEIVDYMDGFRATGEDGGVVIQDLKELVHNKKEGLTESRHELGERSHIEVLIYENDQYKFICVEDTEEEVSTGGTCYNGSVEVYRKS